MKRRLFTAVVLLLLCARGSQSGTYAAGPQRIISLVPAATEMLFAMGVADRVVGVSTYDTFPPEVSRLPKLGGLVDPATERILSLKPDLVIVYETQTQFLRQLERAGVPTFLYIHRDLSDVARTVRNLGARVDAGPASTALADRIESDINAIRARVAGRPRPKTLLVIGREPGSIRNVVASGGYGFLHDMLEAAGGADVLADIKRESVPMSAELLLTRAPDVIIELRYGDTSVTPAAAAADLVSWNALASLPAVKAHRVHALMGEEFVVPGPRVVDATRALSRTLHPEAWTR